MATLKNPKMLIEAAANYGVELDPTFSFDEHEPLASMHAQFNGTDAEFGLFAKLWGKKFDRKFRKGIKAVGKVAKIAVPVAAFVIPGIGPAIGVSLGAAMAAGDKVLGGLKPAERKKIISNTKALASLGDPDAKRGLMILNTVNQIRVQKKTPEGKRAVPKPAVPLKQTQVFRAVTQPQVYRLATLKHAAVAKAAAKPPAKKPVAPKKIATVTPITQKLTFWTRVKIAFGIGLDKVNVTVKPTIKKVA